MSNNLSTMRDWIDALNYYTKKYDEGDPEITDAEWDKLYFGLIKMEKETGIIYPDSPTQVINYQVVNQLKKVKHNHPMLSLDKTKDIKELQDFVADKDYIMMAKLDGLTCSLYYMHGELVAAETRGNGIEGEDILHNAMVVKNIPSKIPYEQDLIVDGEIICNFKDFKKIGQGYANPRNFAAGSIRLLDSHESAKRQLSFIAWDIIHKPEYKTLSDKLYTLYYLGFDTVPHFTSKAEQVEITEDLIDGMKNICKDFGYPIDGLVIKYDNCEEYEACGRTDHHFKGGIAFKFTDEEYETRLLDIEWTMGRTGVLTPVAIFEPVDTGDSIIERANLHNISVMQKMLHGNGYKGQKIKVAKMNDIIPQVVWAEGE